MGQNCAEKILIFCLIFIFPVCFIVHPAMAAGTETFITTYNNNGFSHQFPRIFNDQIVWQDFAYDANGNGLGIISVYNITSGIETQVTDNTTYATNPAIFGDLITYTDCGNDWTCSSGTTIYLYNITSGTRIPLSTGVDTNDNSAIYNNRIVWQNTSLVSSTPRSISTAPRQLLRPRFQERVLTKIPRHFLEIWSSGWMRVREIRKSISTILRQTKVTSIATPNTGWDEEAPAIYGNRIIWEDSRDNGKYETFINGTSPGLEYSLSPNSGTIGALNPAIFGNWVVWFNTTSGTTDNYDIYVNNTSTYQTIPIALDRYDNDAEHTSIAYSPALAESPDRLG